MLTVCTENHIHKYSYTQITKHPIAETLSQCIAFFNTFLNGYFLTITLKLLNYLEIIIWWIIYKLCYSIHFMFSPSSVAQSCSSLCDPMDCSMPGFPVHHQLLELAQIHVHQVGDAIQPSHPLLSPSPPTFKLSQHQGLFQWVSSLHQVAKVLEFQLQSFQWIFRTDLL